MPKFNFNGFFAKRYITTHGTTYFEIFDAIMNKYGAIFLLLEETQLLNNTQI